MTAGPYSIGSEHWPGLSKLIEECGEVLQIAGKIIGRGGDPAHWDGKGDLVERLEDELGDLRAAIAFVLDVNPALSRGAVEMRYRDKVAVFHDWHKDPA